MNEAPRLFRCAVCSAIKGDGNNWLLVFELVGFGMPRMITSQLQTCDGWSEPRTSAVLSQCVETHVCVSHWDDSLALQRAMYPVCGNGHAHVLVDRWLSSKSLEASRKPASEANERTNQ